MKVICYRFMINDVLLCSSSSFPQQFRLIHTNNTVKHMFSFSMVDSQDSQDVSLLDDLSLSLPLIFTNFFCWLYRHSIKAACDIPTFQNPKTPSPSFNFIKPRFKNIACSIRIAQYFAPISITFYLVYI